LEEKIMSGKQDNIKIRGMVEDDLAAVNDVDNSLEYGKGRVTSWPYSFEIYWNIYKPSIVFVAELNGGVTGFLAGYIEQEERSKSLVMRAHSMVDMKPEKIGWIEIMGIRPEAWHKGIGSRLIEAFQAECKKNKATMRIVLRHDDTELNNFFRNVGFESPEFVTLEKRS
jgi:ribosomal protein S18 acetylase RimI-like enzyme